MTTGVAAQVDIGKTLEVATIQAGEITVAAVPSNNVITGAAMAVAGIAITAQEVVTTGIIITAISKNDIRY
jgi:hypothetical protein